MICKNWVAHPGTPAFLQIGCPINDKYLWQFDMCSTIAWQFSNDGLKTVWMLHYRTIVATGLMRLPAAAQSLKMLLPWNNILNRVWVLECMIVLIKLPALTILAKDLCNQRSLSLAHSCIIAAASWNLCPNSQSQLQMRESFTASLAQAKLIDTSRENHHLSRSIEYQISIT